MLMGPAKIASRGTANRPNSLLLVLATTAARAQTGAMRVLLKFVLDCPPDAAWRALRSPAVFREVSSPLMTIESLDPGGFPTIWEEGSHEVKMRALGILPVGTQTISLSFTERADGVRIVHDSGGPSGGSLATVSSFDHQMAIAPDPAGTGKTLYRDQLTFGAGPLTLAAWYPFWAFWQLRGARIRQLAPSWNHVFDHDEVAAVTPPDAASAPESDQNRSDSTR